MGMLDDFHLDADRWPWLQRPLRWGTFGLFMLTVCLTPFGPSVFQWPLFGAVGCFTAYIIVCMVESCLCD